ncbi:MAG: hypothetical protein AAGF47_02700 [Planctomycetota bacterium]
MPRPIDRQPGLDRFADQAVVVLSGCASREFGSIEVGVDDVELRVL